MAEGGRDIAETSCGDTKKSFVLSAWRHCERTKHDAPTTTTTIAQAIAEAAASLDAAGVADARREAASLLAHVLNRDRTFLITRADEKLGVEDVARFRQAAARRAGGEPFQYITGRQEFYRLDFEVTPDVLIPRPETELLVETALELLKETGAPRVCDVGTGSGCIALSLLHERQDAHAVALDISARALAVAARNAARHSLSERVEFVQSDCLTALEASGDEFALIVSNPPYIAADEIEGLQREVREHEPHLALTPGGDGLGVIRRLLLDAPRFVVAGGYLIFEIGFDQHAAVTSLIDPRTWTLLDIKRDLQGIPRSVVLKRVR